MYWGYISYHGLNKMYQVKQFKKRDERIASMMEIFLNNGHVLDKTIDIGDSILCIIKSEQKAVVEKTVEKSKPVSKKRKTTSKKTESDEDL
jgi:hypothetical protein